MADPQKQNLLIKALFSAKKYPPPQCIKCQNSEEVEAFSVGWDAGPYINWRCKKCVIIWNLEDVFTNNVKDPHFIPRKDYK